MSNRTNLPLAHALAWSLSTLVAVPVLYLLTMPPIYHITCDAYGGREPGWLMIYVTPARELHSSGWLNTWYKDYSDWWQYEVFTD